VEYIMAERSSVRVSSTVSGAVHRGLPSDFGVSTGVTTSHNTGHRGVNTPHFDVEFLDFCRLIRNFPRGSHISSESPNPTSILLCCLTEIARHIVETDEVEQIDHE
jgi:hypothetical protein